MKGWNVARALAVARFANPELRAFVRYVLLSKPSKHLIDTRLNTTVQKTLNLKDIKELPVPIPPPKELANIVGILSKLDDKIDLNRRMNETLEEMARALFKDWFVDFGPTKAKIAGREAYLAPDLWALFPERLDEEGKPEGWQEEPLSEFFSIIGGGTPKTSVGAYWGGDIPWFSVVDTPPEGSIFVLETEKSITQRGLDDSAARLVPAGTTIISARGTVGNLAVAARDMTFNQSCYALRGKGGVGNCFVFFSAQHMVTRFQSVAHGSVFSTITRQTFEALSMPKATQDVLHGFEALIEPLLQRVKSNVAESRILAQTRALLLPKLMSGEVRVGAVEKVVGEVL